MNFKHIILEKRGPVAKLTLNRPKAVNALNVEMSGEIKSAIEKIKGDEEVRILVLAGAGSNFSAGDDISEFDDWGDVSGVVDRIRLYQWTSNEIENLDKITIAAVDGYACGGGLELTMVCDFVIATERARFGIPEIDIGITPGWGGTQRLARLVGRRKVKEMIFTGVLIDAREAERLNLINKVVPVDKLDEAVNDLVDLLLSKSPTILKMGKLIINKGIEADLNTALAFEALSTTICWQTNAKREGCHSFLEKREPWTRAREVVQQYFGK